jgi:hypothetical protein
LVAEFHPQYHLDPNADPMRRNFDLAQKEGIFVGITGGRRLPTL